MGPVRGACGAGRNHEHLAAAAGALPARGHGRGRRRRRRPREAHLHDRPGPGGGHRHQDRGRAAHHRLPDHPGGRRPPPVGDARADGLLRRHLRHAVGGHGPVRVDLDRHAGRTVDRARAIDPVPVLDPAERAAAGVALEVFPVSQSLPRWMP